MNIQKKIEAKWLVSLGLTLFMGLAHMMMLHGMEPEQPKDQLAQYATKLQQLQLKKDVITYLGSYNLQPILTLDHGDKITTVMIAGNIILTESEDGTAKMWDINNGNLLQANKGPESPFKIAVKLGDNVASVLGDKVVISQISTNQILYVFKAHNGFINSVAGVGDRLVTGSDDKTAKIWSINTGDLLHTLEGHTREVMAVAAVDDKVATASWDSTVKIWDINDGTLLHTLDDKWVKSVAIAGDKVVTGARDGTIVVWDINAGTVLSMFKGHTDWIRSIAVVADDKVVTGSDDHTAKMWDLSINSANIPDNLQGTSENNPLVWIMRKATIPQLDFIKRAYEAKIAKNDLILVFPKQVGEIQKNPSQAQKDAHIYISFPEKVREYLLGRLNIRR